MNASCIIAYLQINKDRSLALATLGGARLGFPESAAEVTGEVRLQTTYCTAPAAVVHRGEGERMRGGGGGGAMPGWLGALVEESFFVGCGSHGRRKKNEKNIFCLGCCTSVCAHCAPAHPSHPLLQVRRYVYNDVIRLDDLEKLIDCSFVQPYTINSAKVVFLKPRPQSRPFKGSGNICLTCDRILQEPFHFCSLSCKVDHVVVQGEDIANILFRYDESEFSFSHLENLAMDGSDFLEDDGARHLEDMVEQHRVCPVSSNGGRGNSGRPHAEAPRRKKSNTTSSNSDFFPQIVLSTLSSRRKGAPHRSPLS